MKRAVLVAFAVVALMGCQPEGIPDSERVDGLIEGPPPVTDCAGGIIVQGMAGPTCATPTPDAGQACTKASDCYGHCMADTRTCSTVSPQFGCFEILTEEGQKVGLCVD